MKGAAGAINYDAILNGVRRLARVNPQRAKAVEKIVALYLKDERDENRARRSRASGRQLASRLLQAHRCESDRPAGFTQQPKTESSARSWRCDGCGAIVTLDKS